eukprot:CAMPEP_0181382046 /NCGR_PEP_ID=MMETSP1106-20121128/20493_1 /TAXON_ID=81844 /ORGANISM="Mantoniella antarctica, Strain SL-175" /LENGTH=231 /DNA_ID=CAMNT_0023501365 /DNA_START=253 /DNA_END=948 /DNA_ORIENTATION=+
MGRGGGGSSSPNDSMFSAMGGAEALTGAGATRPPLQVLCHMCGYEYGTSSLALHQRTCAKKHLWGVEHLGPGAEATGADVIACKAQVAQCSTPSRGPVRCPAPTARSAPPAFHAFNQEAAEIFRRHVGECWLCRSNDGGRFEAAEAARALRGQRAEQAEEEARRGTELARQRHEAAAEEKRRWVRGEAERRRQEETHEISQARGDADGGGAHVSGARSRGGAEMSTQQGRR